MSCLSVTELSCDMTLNAAVMCLVYEVHRIIATEYGVVNVLL